MVPTGVLGRRCCWTSSGQRVETEFQVRYQGQSGLRATTLGTARADETADDGGVFGNDGYLPAVDLDAVVHHVAGDLAVIFGGDTGQAELTDDALGVDAADAGVLLEEVVPGQAEFLVGTRFFHLVEGERLSGGAFLGDDGQGLLAADAGALVVQSGGACVISSITMRFRTSMFGNFGWVC
jgi:hypothetical protein